MPTPEHIRRLRAKVGHDPLFLPGVCPMVFDDDGRILLQQRVDGGRWGLLGGIPEPGEEPADTAVREVYEETGLHVEPVRLVGVYASGPITYANGDRAQYSTTVLRCRVLPGGGEPRVNDDESLDVRFFDLSELPELRADQLVKVRDALRDGPASFAPPTWSPPR